MGGGIGQPGTPVYSAPVIIINGDFETPTVPVGGFTLFPTGSTAITGWTVVGPPGGNVVVVSGTFTQTNAWINFAWRATKLTVMPGSNVSSTIQTFSDAVQRRRR